MSKGTMLYVCGPMSGRPDHNLPAFREAASRLTQAGFFVLSPARHAENLGVDRPWRDYMRLGLRDMLRCDGVATLPGFADSKGALIETDLAIQIGIPVNSIEVWIARAKLVPLPVLRVDNVRGDL